MRRAMLEGSMLCILAWGWARACARAWASSFWRRVGNVREHVRSDVGMRSQTWEGEWAGAFYCEIEQRYAISCEIIKKIILIDISKNLKYKTRIQNKFNCR